MGMGVRFQSTQPSQAVTRGHAYVLHALSISIHTALAGCDYLPLPHRLPVYVFQSTQPSQAVTMVHRYEREVGDISIHTALAGCDSNHTQNHLHINKTNLYIIYSNYLSTPQPNQHLCLSQYLFQCESPSILMCTYDPHRDFIFHSNIYSPLFYHPPFFYSQLR